MLLNFWASWCGPCRQEMPELDALHRKYASLGFTVFGVNVEQDRAMAAKILRDIPVSFPILFDDDNVVSQLYEVDAMPVTVLVDRYGDIRFMHRGYKPGYELEYEQQLRALIRNEAMVKRVRLPVLLSLLPVLAACGTQPWVKPYERQHLADPS